MIHSGWLRRVGTLVSVVPALGGIAFLAVFSPLPDASGGESSVAAVAITPPPTEWSAGFDAIDETKARAWLTFLAGPECAGRGTGQEGYQVAARFVADRFKEIGLKPLAEGSYFQDVPFVRSIPLEGAALHVGSFSLALGESLGVSRLSGELEFSGELVFLTAVGPDARIPDSLDLEGKGLVVMSRGTGREFSRDLFRRRPAVRISVVDEVSRSAPRLRPQSSNPSRRGGGPRVEITRDAARGLALLIGVDPSLVDPQSDEAPVDKEEPVRWSIGTTPISLNVQVRDEEVMVPNVVGLLEGGDPVLREQHIGVGAHLDHLGIQDGVVFPGADDDGSGVTAMLLVADALAHNPVRPARSVLFMAFCGEEVGLIGSDYYTSNPLLPLEEMSCLLQMDMVGRNEETATEPASENVDSIHLVGSQHLQNELHDLTLAANEHVGFSFEYDEERVFSRSDHAKFAAKGVPITFLFSGFHPDYHQATDTLDRIEFHKIVRAARLNYLVAQKVAAMPEMLGRDKRSDS